MDQRPMDLDQFCCPTCDKLFFTKTVFKFHVKKKQCLKTFNKEQVSQGRSAVNSQLPKLFVSTNVDSTVKSSKNEVVNLHIVNNPKCDPVQNFLPIVDCSNIPQQRQKEQAAVYDKLKPHHCQECNKAFKRKELLQRHINIVHKKLKPFQCQDCHSFFAQKENLKVHFNSMHMKIKPFRCQECNRSYGDKSNFQLHIQRVHEKLKPYGCLVCKKTFSQNGHLQIHMNDVHFKIKPLERQKFQEPSEVK